MDGPAILDTQNEGVIENARALQNSATAGAAPEDGGVADTTKRHIYLCVDLVSIADDHEMLHRLPKAEEFVGHAYRAYFDFLVEDRPTFDLLRRNAGTIRALMDEPALGAAAVADLIADLREAIGRGEMPALDAEYMAGCAQEADEGVSLEEVRAALAKIPGSLTEDFIAEREDR